MKTNPLYHRYSYLLSALALVLFLASCNATKRTTAEKDGIYASSKVAKQDKESQEAAKYFQEQSAYINEALGTEEDTETEEDAIETVVVKADESDNEVANNSNVTIINNYNTPVRHSSFWDDYYYPRTSFISISLFPRWRHRYNWYAPGYYSSYYYDDYYYGYQPYYRHHHWWNNHYAPYYGGYGYYNDYGYNSNPYYGNHYNNNPYYGRNRAAVNRGRRSSHARSSGITLSGRRANTGVRPTRTPRTTTRPRGSGVVRPRTTTRPRTSGTIRPRTTTRPRTSGTIRPRTTTRPRTSGTIRPRTTTRTRTHSRSTRSSGSSSRSSSSSSHSRGGRR